jgi:hypothetical protein
VCTGRAIEDIQHREVSFATVTHGTIKRGQTLDLHIGIALFDAGVAAIRLFLRLLLKKRVEVLTEDKALSFCNHTSGRGRSGDGEGTRRRKRYVGAMQRAPRTMREVVC